MTARATRVPGRELATLLVFWMSLSLFGETRQIEIGIPAFSGPLQAETDTARELQIDPAPQTAASSTGSYSQGNPTNAEQLLLELINRARANPGAEAARLGISLNQGLPAGTISDTPKQPLALHPALTAAARGHSQWMIDEDVFDHTGEGGSDAGDRMEAAGYPFSGSSTWGENIAYSGTTGPLDLIAHTRTAHDSLFISPGHRKNLMNAAFDEIGLGVLPGVFTSGGTSFNCAMVTENFAKSGGSPSPEGPFVTGVVFQDADGDGFYDPGEGVPGVAVSASPGPATATTSSSGGYALPMGATRGTVTISFSRAGFTETLVTVQVATSGSAKADLDYSNFPEAILNLSGDLSFGSLLMGQSATRTLVVSNAGTSPLFVTAVAFPAGFSGNWATAQIAPGASKSLAVKFAPSGSQVYGGTVSFTSNASSGTFSLPISGTGVAPAPDIAIEYPLGASLDSGGSPIPFGTVTTGFQSAAKTFQIRNTGSANLTLSLPTVTGSGTAHFALSTKGTATVLKPRATTRFTVAFAPTSEGPKDATLAIASNDDDEDPFEVPLWGTAIPPDFRFAVSQGIDHVDLPPDIAGPFETVLSVAGLPSGLKYDPKTGKLTGTPAKAGAYTVKGRVRNLVDGTIRSVDMTIYVEALPAWAVGTFTSLISPPEDPASQPLTGLGGYLRLTSSVSGTCTGSLILGAKKLSFKGQIEGVPEEDREEEGLSTTVTIVPNSKDRTQDITLDLNFRPEDAAGDPGLTGTLTFLGAEMSIGPGWQHLWSSKTNPAFGNKDRVLNVALDNTEDTEGPQGDSLAILKLTKAGLATWSGTLADGRKVTGSFTASPDGDLPFYAAIPYPGGGALIALLATEPVGELLGVVDEDDPNGRWIKRAPLVEPKTLDRSYATGFDLDLDIDGAQFTAPLRGQLLFGNEPSPISLSMELRDAGIDSSTQLPGEDPVVLAAELQAGNKLVVTQSDLPPKFTLAPKLSASSGSFSLSAKLSDLGPGTTKPVARTLTCTGLYIPDLLTPQDSAIRGFFQLPELPEPGQSAGATAIRSGALEVDP